MSSAGRERNLNRVIVLYYGFQFFFSLFLWLPVFYEYQKRIGLSDPQIFAIQSIYYWVFCLLEIPTGLLADQWGYRFCIRAGSLVLVGAGVFPIFVLNYSGFLWHFLLIALARSLISGAASAYLYEYLKGWVPENTSSSSLGTPHLSSDGISVSSSALDRYKKIEGNARAYSLAGKVILWSGMGALMEWHLALPYVLTLLANGVAVVFAFLFPPLWPSTLSRSTSERRNFLKWSREIFGMLFKSPILVLIMIQGVSIFTLSRIVQVNLFQPLLNQKSFKLGSHGAVMSLMTVFETLGSFWPVIVAGLVKRERVRRYLNDLNTVFLMTLAMSVSLLGVEFSAMLGTLVALAVFSFATGASFPVQRQLINDAIPNSRFRATLLSIESIVDRAACAAVAGIISTWMAAGQGAGRMNDFLWISSWVSIVSLPVLYFLIRLFSF